MLKFSLGKIIIAQDIISFLSQVDIQNLIWRHANLDFGDISQEDIKTNIEAIETKNKIISSYIINEKKVFIITDNGHETTTIFLSE